MDSEEDRREDDDDIEGYLAVVPQPPGDEKQWLAGLIGPGGLTRPGLVEVAQQNRIPGDFPPDMEPMVFTLVRYSVRQPERVAGILKKETPEFIFIEEKEGNYYFAWPYELLDDAPGSRTNPAAGKQLPISLLTMISCCWIQETFRGPAGQWSG